MSKQIDKKNQSISDLKVCFIRNVPSAASETFIDAQVNGLPCHTFSLYGEPAKRDNESFISESVASRALLKLGRKFFGKGEKWHVTKSYLAAFRKYKPDVVIAQFGPAGVRVAEACQMARIPLIVYFRGFDASVYDVLDRYRDAYRSLFVQSHALIAVSQDIRARLIALGADSKKIIYDVSSDVDFDRVTSADPRQSPPSFLIVGRLVEKKAPHLSLLAFYSATQRCPGITLRLIGDGPLAGVCRDLVQSLNLSASVELMGEREQSEVFSWMRCSRAFLQHSVVALNGDSEGTPISILEAGASGLPVIATRHAGIADVVIHEETGYLVDEHDIESMADYICKMANNPDLAYQLGQKSRLHICQKFNRDQSMSTLIKIIQNAVYR